VPVKLLNASNNKITIPKGKNIADFSIISDDYTYISLPEQSDIPEAQNIQVVGGELDTEINESKPHYENTKRSDLIDNIKKEFNISEHLTDTQKSELAECLFDNFDLFVTNENPNLGYTNLVEHKIHLKPNVISKHQKPYRLPPYKREILREQLDNLLEQGIIVPVNETGAASHH